jgi:hypothetical protein
MLPDATPRRLTIAGTLVIGLLLAMRVPSVVQPMGGDQGIYGSVGQAIRDGGAPYVDAWDQKPPGIHIIYAALWTMWPHESVVPATDLVVAGLVAWLLVVIGGRTFGAGAGYLAAALFLAFGNPAFQRLDGVFVRSQCETFIALAVTAALALLTTGTREPWRLMAVGVCLAVAFWLKYNAAVYAVPVCLAIAGHRGIGPSGDRAIGPSDDRGIGASGLDLRTFAMQVAWVGAAGLAVSTLMIVWLSWHGALADLWLATIDYNLRYSRETYRLASPLLYPFQMIWDRIHVDAIWFLGCIGAALLIPQLRHRRAWIAVVWIACALVSIAINGRRDLPQYFVQAHPALALAAGAGLVSLRERGRLLQMVAGTLIVIGLLWKVGDETTPGLRFAGVPGVIDNLRLDVSAVRGRISRDTYLGRFGGQRSQDKFNALAVEQLTDYARQTTKPDDIIYIFGFSPGVFVKSDRVSASRFVWSRPVVIEFAADHPGYGSTGLRAELERRPPVFIALQRQDWGPVAANDPGRHGELNSIDFFTSTPVLREWLDAHYTLDRDTPEYEIWRRKP